jgi:hypothetical protein
MEFQNIERSITLVANKEAPCMQKILQSAALKYQCKETLVVNLFLIPTAGAYLHWYRKYGCGDDEFEDAFESLRTVIKNYHQMSSPT